MNHQIILYTSYLHIIGGIETFVFSFIDMMADSYDIAILCPNLPFETRQRLKNKGIKFYQNENLQCETLIMVRMMDIIPRNVTFKRSIRMCHATKSNPTWNILQDCDAIVHVSEASKKSFNSEGVVIYNPVTKTSKKAIILVSATRIPAPDKGKNAERMLKLAKMLNAANIPFLWFNFSDAPLKDAPKGFMNIGAFQDIQPYIAKADYLVQLSDQEGFGYSVLEALINNTAVICTPFDTTAELGVEDGVNGYIVPFNLNFDVRKLLDVPMFEYTWSNEKIKKEWDKLFKTKPKPRKKIMVEVISPYHDIALDKDLSKGYRLEVTEERARQIAKYCRRV